MAANIETYVAQTKKFPTLSSLLSMKTALSKDLDPFTQMTLADLESAQNG